MSKTLHISFYRHHGAILISPMPEPLHRSFYTHHGIILIYQLCQMPKITADMSWYITTIFNTMVFVV